MKYNVTETSLTTFQDTEDIWMKILDDKTLSFSDPTP